MKSHAEKTCDRVRQCVVLTVQLHIAPLVTGPIVLARLLGTLLDIDAAILALIARPAHAAVVIDQILASGIVLARRHRALVDIILAVNASEAGVGAVARVLVDTVTALAAVHAGL